MQQRIDMRGYLKIRRQFWERAYLAYLASHESTDYAEGVSRHTVAATEADRVMEEWDKRFKPAIAGRKRR